MSQYMSCFSFTYIVIHPENEKYLKYFPMYLYLKVFVFQSLKCRVPWLRGRASDSQLREPGFESCATVLKPWASFFTPHCSSSLSYINEYLTIDICGYVYKQPLCVNCSIWVEASQRSWDGVWVNRSVREVKCKALWTVLRIGYCAI